MILMNDFKAEPAELRSQMQAAVNRVIESGWYVLGEECKRFEQQWAGMCGTTHGVGVANGMDAIEIALRSMGIGEGDEVITTPMTAFASVLAILRVGAVPVLADIEPDTALLSIASAGRCLTSKTRAVLLVHLYGQIRNMDEWQQFCSSSGIELVEDCAQAHLATLGGRVAGSFGKAAAFSFYPTKNLGALGDGGMFVTSDDDIANRGRILRNYGQSERYHHPVVGLNSRLDEMQAAILGARLKWLHEFSERRKQVAEHYLRGIRNAAVTLLSPPTARDAHVWHLFVTRCTRRDALSAHLKEKGVQSLIHDPIPVHRQPPCLQTRKDPAGLPASEAHADVCLSIPCHPQLTDADVSQVIDAVNGFKG